MDEVLDVPLLDRSGRPAGTQVAVGRRGDADLGVTFTEGPDDRP